MEKKITMDELVAFLKNQGYVYQGSEIYGGLANAWDYGPLGVELLNNIKKMWWKKFVQESKTNVGLDAAILMNPRVWVASGHVGGFSDPLIDCKSCGVRYRADKLIEDFTGGKETGDGWSNDKLMEFVKDNQIPCPDCGKSNWTDIRKFNLMFKTNMGVIDDAKNIVYLRPETAQGIFVNFKNVQRTSRKKLPFGICQVGKAFRNEITPGNFVFRTREFEQMEMEFFCKPGTDLEWFNYWKQYCIDFLDIAGLDKDKLRYRDHAKEELAFYSKATTDIEYNFLFGWGELWGIADRTDYDLGVHQKTSGETLEYFDPETNEKYIPYVIEPSVGVGRLLLAIVSNAYDVEDLEDGETREVLRLKPYLAPFTCAVLPLTNKLANEAEELRANLAKEFNCDYDTSGKIGKRYRRQDAMGTPFCITFDFDSLEDKCVTVRDRDTMAQERIKIDDLVEYLKNKIKY
ncbi:MAG: glycine--tRNA ligase [Bacilli bacterium]|nr:glycine--tRNA ligase [Bacilli bacterium]